MQACARGYVERGQEPGGFLQAVLENKLMEAYNNADEVNALEMKAWASWLWNDAPGGCWGDPAKVQAWLEHRGQQGLREAAEEEA
jgi:hypothetical protein